MKRTARICCTAMLLTWSAAAHANDAPDAYHDAVVIVLDASGSMENVMEGGRKIDVAKRALVTVLAHVPNTTHVGLLVFGAENGWAYELGTLERRALAGVIDHIIAARGTPLGEYMKIGADRLLEERKRQYGYGSYRLLVVTDGEANDQDLVNQFAPDITSRGLVLDVIGVAMAQDHSLKQYAHTYRAANDPRSLERAISEVFAEVSAKGSDRTAADAVFADLEGLEPEAATAMLAAFATASNTNHPIGEAPPPPPQTARADGDADTPAPAPMTTIDVPIGGCGCHSTIRGLSPWLALAFLALLWTVSGKRT